MKKKQPKLPNFDHIHIHVVIPKEKEKEKESKKAPRRIGVKKDPVELDADADDE